MIYHVRLRRRLYYLYRHPCFFACFIISVILVIFFYNDIIYFIHISTFNAEPYENSLTIWSIDYHISPIRDLKTILTPLGVQFFDKSLSYSCQLVNTCNSPLRILTRKNAFYPTKELAQKFYSFYKDQIEMNLVDAFVCFHPASMCELYMPFNRSLIIIASTRYELAKRKPTEWKSFNENLKIISQDPKNIIAANNLYDAEYIRYFTGINVTLLPSFCNYGNVKYNPIRKEFLRSPIHSKQFEQYFDEELQKILYQNREKTKIKIVSLRKMYKKYEYSDLTKHPAIIHIPYQVSIMSLFEQYRMNIPLVFPSLDLLTKWHHERGVVNEKTLTQTYSYVKPGASLINGVLPNIPDPNNDLDESSIRYWLNFSDFYQWPHIVYFNSMEDLVLKLETTNFQEVSNNMQIYNNEFQADLFKNWKNVLNRIRTYSKKADKIPPWE